MKMECPRCHNKNTSYLYKVNHQYYCRHCISFFRVFIDDKRLTKRKVYYPQKHIAYHLDFGLSFQQSEISKGLLECYQQKQNAYVFAVCGSGKTEIVFEVMAYALNQGHRVGFCIPRKELVKELYERIKHSFQNIDIGLLYGGVNENEDAQLIICTTHQLYRFENHYGFDLLIADEVDAFPFYCNDVLEEIFKRCCVGTFIKLSATFKEKDIQDGRLFVMNRRYHQVDLPIPRNVIIPQYIQKIGLLVILLWMKKRWIVYVPTRHMVDQLVSFLSFYGLLVEGVSSLTTDNQEKIHRLKSHTHYILVSTTILERGVTIEDVHVIVYHGEYPIFDERTLIQIAGRVGRKPNFPHGHVIILSSIRTKEISQCIRTIRRLNQKSA